MSIRVHVGGQIFASEDARVSVFDRGFLYGDSIYETLATVKGRLFALADRLDRLERSALRIGIVPPPRAEIEQAVAATVRAAGNPETRCGSWSHGARVGAISIPRRRPIRS